MNFTGFTFPSIIEITTDFQWQMAGLGGVIKQQ